MMGGQDTFAGFGRETTYGTPVTPTRSFEVEADQLDVELQHLEYMGHRSGRHTQLEDHVRALVIGAAGSVPLTVLTKGFGMLWRAMMGTSANALAGGAAAAFLQQHDSTPYAPDESLTYQIVRGRTDPTNVQVFTYHGCKVTGFEIAQAADDVLKLTVDLDAEDEDTTTAAHVETQIAGAVPFGWPDLLVTIDGTPVDVRSFSFRADLGLKTDRRQLRRSRLKKKPLRASTPTYEINLDVDFDDTTQYARVISGARVPVVANWERSDIEIEAGYSPYLELNMPKVQFRGNTPKVDVDGEIPTQSITGTVLHDASNPAVSLDYQTADTSY